MKKKKIKQINMKLNQRQEDKTDSEQSIVL